MSYAVLLSNFVIVTIGLIIVQFSVSNVTAAPVGDNINKQSVVPGVGDVEEWKRCYGLDCSDWKYTQRTVEILKQLQADTEQQQQQQQQQQQAGMLSDFVHTGISLPVTQKLPTFPAAIHERSIDILLTPSQATRMLVEAINARAAAAAAGGAGHVTGRRVRRKVVSSRQQLWDLPIAYKFDGTHNDEQMTMIRNAMSHWQQNTCVRFNELTNNIDVPKNSLVFVNYFRGCSSFVGKVSLLTGRSQMINLSPDCLTKLGVAVHEIGHALGLWHEHQRVIRDSYVDVIYSNMASWAISNFQKPPSDSVLDYGLPYDVNSVMHYSSQVGALKDDLSTLKTKDDQFQRNIGQREGLSFFDSKAINLAYCKGVCTNYIQLKCLNGGYQDPTDCSRCRCPEGLGGTTCDQPAPSSTGACGSSLIQLADNSSTTIQSPGYSEYQQYEDRLECNYLVKSAAVGGRLTAQFVGDFHVNSPLVSCQHWVEIRYKADLSLAGPRFCGDETPTLTLKSDSEQLLVMFRTPNSSLSFVDKRGFQLLVTAHH